MSVCQPGTLWQHTHYPFVGLFEICIGDNVCWDHMCADVVGDRDVGGDNTCRNVVGDKMCWKNMSADVVGDNICRDIVAIIIIIAVITSTCAPLQSKSLSADVY